MRCAEFELRLNELLDERLAPGSDPALRAHAQQCGECRGLLAAMGAAVEGAEALAAPAAPGDLAARVVAAWSAPEPVAERPSAAWRALAWKACAAAALAASLVGIAVWLGRSAPEAVAPELPPLAADTSVDALAREATASYQALADETRQSVSDALLLVPGLGPRTAAMESAAPPAAGASWVEGWQEGLAPVSSSTRSAFGSLWELVAPVEGESTS